MKRFGVLGILGLGLFFLFACRSATTTLPNAAATETQGAATPTSVKPAITMTPTLQATTLPPQSTEEPPSFLLGEPGPYFAGNRVYTLIDDSRGGREIELLIWYPALAQTDADGRSIVRDAVPDASNAPYPLIITEENSGKEIFLSHLATYGFVMVVVKDSHVTEEEVYSSSSGFQNVRDFLFSLDQVSTNPPDGLENLIDTNRVGVTGYSYGGDICLVE